MRRAPFLQLKQQFTYFLNIIRWKTGWNIFFKKRYVWATWYFYINPVQQKIHRRCVDNVEVNNYKKAWHWGWRPFLMIPELYTSPLSCFGKWSHKCGFVLVLHLFRVTSSFKSEKGDTFKFSSKGLIYKQKIYIVVPLNYKRFIL